MLRLLDKASPGSVTVSADQLWYAQDGARLRLARSTGRVLEAAWTNAGFTWSLRFDHGAFDAAMHRLARSTTAASIAETVAAGIDLADDLLAAESASRTAAPDDGAAVLRALHPVLTTCLTKALVMGIQEIREPGSLTDGFTIPVDVSAIPPSAGIGLMVYRIQDLLLEPLPTTAWPRRLARTVSFILLGESSLAGEDAKGLALHPPGPLGCLLVATLARHVGQQPMAEAFASIGLHSLSEPGLRRDLAQLRPWTNHLATSLRSLPTTIDPAHQPKAIAAMLDAVDRHSPGNDLILVESAILAMWDHGLRDLVEARLRQFIQTAKTDSW